MALTVVQIKAAKPKEKPYKLADERGLYLLVNPSGSKLWKLKYRFAGIEKKLSLGAFPEVSLAEARDKREDARKYLTNNIDPGVLKNSIKRSKKEAAENSFEAIAREWHAKFTPKWTDDHGKRILIRLEQNIFPWIGKRPIKEVTAPELLSALRRVEARGAVETAHRILQICGQVFRYSIVTERGDRDISADLKGALAPVKKRHHASITEPTEVGKLLRAINAYKGSFVTKCALQLAPLFFVRPGELRQSEWVEFNIEKAEWRIPAEKMKMRQTHIVPLCTQAIHILQELKPYTGEGKYLFPCIRTPQRPMSENTILGALRRLGYTSDEMTGHGFRSMASTLLNEQGWNPDAIERQLAHAERNNIRAAYNYAEYLPERRQMMQSWGDYLEELVVSRNEVIQFKIG
ncbi:tyrosine-type recombinase/integrase [Legionella sp. MW5194]|uniref:tyrosine-type recombinase/integrase n=1 Tax=Legionella sp. MW5194 TaxID=2662448 RepID=UPI00193E7FA9|nr:integrase arm-type DNA-binding domain-containing protein [Legionella sp. MW5194]QRN02547.1 tyrosine-type recombinase/integrase [Legionella sp. MW5194]